MGQNKYDIFISYRRTAYDTANLVAEKLRNAGYSVFFDIDTLTSGKFNEQLLTVILNCKDFILILPKDGLDRCDNPEDWIRREVACAIDSNKNIIPIMLTGFEWPDELPEDIAELPKYQAIAPAGHAYFDMAVERLKSYLKSKPSVPIKTWFTKAAIVLAVLLTFVGIGYGVVHHIANVTCERIAAQQSNVMGAVDAIGTFRNDLMDYSSSFFSAMEKSQDEEDRRELESEISETLKKTDKEIQYYKKTFPAPDFKLSGIENYVLALYGINPEELNAFSAFYLSFYDDIEETSDLLKEMIASHKYPREYKDIVKRDLTCMTYSINAFYYGYLGSISLLPKGSRKNHYELSKKWKNFPNGTPLDLSQEEYEQFQLYEINRFEEEVEKYGVQVNFEERKLNDLEKQIDDLSNAIESIK